MEIVASDMGTPSLSGTATLTVNILDSNDKVPSFTPQTQRTEISENAAVDQEGNEVLDSAGFKNYFSIDKTGVVTLKKTLRRDLFAVRLK
jgi:hypothetical protein